jgi:hypothetical protein
VDEQTVVVLEEGRGWVEALIQDIVVAVVTAKS